MPWMRIAEQDEHARWIAVPDAPITIGEAHMLRLETAHRRSERTGATELIALLPDAGVPLHDVPPIVITPAQEAMRDDA